MQLTSLARSASTICELLLCPVIAAAKIPTVRLARRTDGRRWPDLSETIAIYAAVPIDISGDGVAIAHYKVSDGIWQRKQLCWKV
jgi:hypothetical protein